MAFQILDDLDDSQKDADANRQVNYANRFGMHEAVSAVQQNVTLCQNSLKHLGLENTPLNSLCEGLDALSRSFML